jgi:hypothetical protein
MAAAGITQTMCTSFKVDCLSGLANFAAGTPYTYYIALYSIVGGAALDATTTSYTGTVGEVSGAGYFTGGAALSIYVPPTSAGTPTTTAYMSFYPISWTGATFSADGALIYNNSLSGKNSVGVLNFGGTKTVSSGTFTIQFPAAGIGSSIIQIA